MNHINRKTADAVCAELLADPEIRALAADLPPLPPPPTTAEMFRRGFEQTRALFRELHGRGLLDRVLIIAAPMAGLDGLLDAARRVLAAQPAAPAPTPEKMTPGKMTDKEAEARVAAYIAARGYVPDITVRQIEAETGVPKSTVGRLTAWRKYADGRDRPRTAVKAMNISPRVMETLASYSGDPAAALDAAEQHARTEADRDLLRQARDQLADDLTDRVPGTRAGRDA